MKKSARLAATLAFITIIALCGSAQSLSPGSLKRDSSGAYRYVPKASGQQSVQFTGHCSLSFDGASLSSTAVSSAALAAARSVDGAKLGSGAAFALSMTQKAYDFSAYPSANGRLDARSTVYDFGPNGLSFKSPATLTIPYSADSVDYRVNVYYYNEKTKIWEIVPTESQDTVNKTITVKISHFSAYIAGQTMLRMDEGGSLDGGNHPGVSVDDYFGTLNIVSKEFSVPTRGIPLELTAKFNSDYLYSKYLTKYTGDERTAGLSLVQAPHLEYSMPQTSTSSGWSYELPSCEFGNSLLKLTMPNGRKYDLYSALVKWWWTASGNEINYPPYYVYKPSSNSLRLLIPEMRCSLVATISVTALFWVVVDDIALYYDDGHFVKFSNSYGNVTKICDASGKNSLTFAYSDQANNIIKSVTHSDGRSVKLYTYTNSDGNKCLVYLLSSSSDTGTLKVGDKFLARRVFDASGRLIRSEALETNDSFIPVTSGWTGISSANEADYFRVLQTTFYGYSLSSSITGNFITVADPGAGTKKFTFDKSFSQMVSAYLKTTTHGPTPEGDVVHTYELTRYYQNKPKVISIEEGLDGSLSSSKLTEKSYVCLHGENRFSSSSKDYSLYYDDGSPSAPWNINPNTTSTEISTSSSAIIKLTKSVLTYSHASDWSFRGVGEETTYQYPAGSTTPTFQSKLVRTFTGAIRGSYYPATEKTYVIDTAAPKYTISYAYDTYGRLKKTTDDRTTGSQWTYYLFGGETQSVFSYPFAAPSSRNLWTAYGAAAGTAASKDASAKLITYTAYDSYLNPIKTLLKDSRSGVAKDITTTYGYDAITNSLDSISYPKGNTVFLDFGPAAYNPAYLVTERTTLDSTLSSTTWGPLHQTDYYTFDIKGKVTSKRSVVYTDSAETSRLDGVKYPVVTRSVALDGLGRATAVGIQKDGDTGVTWIVKRSYDDTNFKVTTTDAKGYITVNSYDAYYRLIKAESYRPDIATRTVDYDGSNKVLVGASSRSYDIAYPKNTLEQRTWADPTGQTWYATSYSYDSLGRPTETRKGDASSMVLVGSMSYDDSNNTVTALAYQGPDKYSMGVTVSDWLGRTKSTTAYDGTAGGGTAYQTSFTYDYLGNVLTKTLPNGEVYGYSYSLSGLLESTVYPDGRGTEILTYDPNGSLATRLDVGGNLVTCAYNSAGLELSSTASATGKTPISVTTAYSQWGPTTVVQTGADEDMAIEFAYDPTGHATSESRTIMIGGNPVVATTTHSYDLAGNLTGLSVTGFDGYTKSLAYSLPYFGGPSDGDRSTSLSSSSGTVLGRVSILFSSALDRIDYASSGYSASYSGYDAFMRPTAIDNPGSAFDQSYAYDYKANVTSWNGISYSYDGLNQLVSGGSDSYSYDIIGNMVTGNSASYCYHALASNGKNTMRLTSGSSGGTTTTFADDANLGNLTAAAGRYSDLKYDAFNRLVLITDLARVANQSRTDSYAYDPAGLRFRKSETLLDGSSETTYYLYEGNSVLYEETWKGGLSTRSALNLFLGGQNIGRYVEAGGVEDLQYFYNDHLGSRRAVTDAYGMVQASIAYSTWGIPTVQAVGSYDASKDLSYTGKELDGTGLYYFNARYYDPAIGRFITEDPVRDGMNWYTYCDNNPLSCTDITGMRTDNGGAGAATFADTVFTRSNPLNQLVLDRALGIKSSGSTTQSCQTTGLINAYAVQNEDGISGAQILEALVGDNGKVKDILLSDGSPADTLDAVSKALAGACGRTTYLKAADQKSTDTSSVGENGGILGYSKIGEKKDSHFGYKYSAGTIDSMDPNRSSAATYEEHSFRSFSVEAL